MNNESSNVGKVRPTKKQRILLEFIDSFIKEHGYSPSYREIMNGLNYTSVATVSLHVNSLIVRGHLRKRDHSARSLEVVDRDIESDLISSTIKPSEEKWLVDKVEKLLSELETSIRVEQARLDDLYVLIGALKVLGMDAAMRSFLPRLVNVRVSDSENPV